MAMRETLKTMELFSKRYIFTDRAESFVLCVWEVGTQLSSTGGNKQRCQACNCDEAEESNHTKRLNSDKWTQTRTRCQQGT